MTREEWNDSDERPQVAVLLAKGTGDHPYAQVQCSNPRCKRHADAWEQLYQVWAGRTPEP